MRFNNTTLQTILSVLNDESQKNNDNFIVANDLHLMKQLEICDYSDDVFEYPDTIGHEDIVKSFPVLSDLSSFESEDIKSTTDMKMIAAKQMAFMGDKERYKEIEESFRLKRFN